MDIITKIIKALLMGLLDSVKGTIAIFSLDKNIKEHTDKQMPLKYRNVDGTHNQKTTRVIPTLKQHGEVSILRRTLQCCMLNGGMCWLSIVLFDYLVLPTIQFIILFWHKPSTGRFLWVWLEPFLHLIFSSFWVMPLFMLSKVVNALWFQDIADSAYRYTRGTPQQSSSISMLIADSLFSIVVQFLFLLQTLLVGLLPIPVLADLLRLVHTCLLYSLYSFEYKWFNMGWELHRRLIYIENNWPYFIGFGIPLAIITSLPNSWIISGCVFSILFPLFIISGNEAHPETEMCNLRLKLFTPVIKISNTLFNRTIGSRRKVR